MELELAEPAIKTKPEELERINNFISLASRSIYLFNKGNGLIKEISEKNKEEVKRIQDENSLHSRKLDEYYKKIESSSINNIPIFFFYYYYPN